MLFYTSSKQWPRTNTNALEGEQSLLSKYYSRICRKLTSLCPLSPAESSTKLVASDLVLFFWSLKLRRSDEHSRRFKLYLEYFTGVVLKFSIGDHIRYKGFEVLLQFAIVDKCPYKRFHVYRNDEFLFWTKELARCSLTRRYLSNVFGVPALVFNMFDNSRYLHILDVFLGNGVLHGE